MSQVTVYTRPFCIWCFRAKRLLRKLGIGFEERDARSLETRAILLARTGRNTVPQVFFGEVPVGGFEDLRRLAERGELPSLAPSA
jgi:glutaredoxin 3